MTPLRAPAAEAAERVHTAEVEEEVTRTAARAPREHHRIATLAYTYWEQRGRPLGSPDVDWSHALAALAPVLPSELPISSLRLEPNEGPWRSGSPGDVVGVSPRLSGGIHASAQ